MKKSTVMRICLVLICCILLAGFLSSLCAEEIHLGSFPEGQWLDTRWQAYWTFAQERITLRNSRDEVLWDFAGIVQRFKVTDLPGGGVRLSFDCAKAKRSYRFERATAKAPMAMEIRPWGSSIAYRTAIPVVTETWLAAFKQAVRDEQPAEIARVVAAIEATQEGFNAPAANLLAIQAVKVEAGVKDILAVAEGADFDALDAQVAMLDTQGIRDAVLQELEAAAGKSDAPPKVFIALSVLYGRMGLKTREYAALELAEKAPLPPRVQLDIALIHGRKQLLASGIDAARFLVGDMELDATPREVEVYLDGTTMGRGPTVLAGIAAGKHLLRLEAEGFETMEVAVDLGVGQCLPVEAALAPKVAAGRSGTMKIGTLKVARGSLEIEVLSPGTLSIAGQEVALDKAGVLPVSDMEAGDYPLIMKYPDGTVRTLNASVEGGKTTQVKFDYKLAPKPTLAPVHTPVPAPVLVPAVPVKPVKTNSLGMDLMIVAGGTFTMGTDAGDSDEKPAHQVKVSSFMMGKTEVTQDQWKKLMGKNPSRFKGDTLPVESVGWLDAIKFCNLLSQREGLRPAYTIKDNVASLKKGADGYRLPTEAQWEYAASGGIWSSPQNWVYAGGDDPLALAWYAENSGKTTHPVGLKQANVLGLFDMSGNVWEWCQDSRVRYSEKFQTDPEGVLYGTSRVVRGGSWNGNKNNMGTVNRSSFEINLKSYDLGFRVVLPLLP